MPESWGEESPGGYSPNDLEAYFDDMIVDDGRESSMYDDYGDESRLVRSASMGKMGRPALVSTRGLGGPGYPSSSNAGPSSGPDPMPIRRGPFQDGAGFAEASNSSLSIPIMKAPTPTPRNVTPSPQPTVDALLKAYGAASSTDPTDTRKNTPSPRPYSRLSAIRRPPKLDMDAAGKRESRASMTSLPDLIRRATRLAAMMDRGKRPASRIDVAADASDGDWRNDTGDEKSVSNERRESRLSDMLAAFPPPAQIGSRVRQSLDNLRRMSAQGSWPLAGGRGGQQGDGSGSADDERSPVKQRKEEEKSGRRCCGLPLWAFLLIMVVVIVIIAAAVVIPLQFFVFRKQTNNIGQTPALQQCQAQLECANGGSNVVSQNLCSCICTNGFTGSTCNVAGATGCTTTNLVSPGAETITNVTIGQAIPRLIAQAEANFSVPLAGTSILAKFNAGNLSCAAENALVTFDGQSVRTAGTDGTGAEGQVLAAGGSFPLVGDTVLAAEPAANVQVAATTLMIPPGSATMTTTVVLYPTPTGAAANPAGDGGGFTANAGAPQPAAFTTVITVGPGGTTTVIATTITLTGGFGPNPTAPPVAAPSAAFSVSDVTVDFARVAVLYILQEETLADAVAAQTALQRFFAAANQAGRSRFGGTSGVTVGMAQNVSLGGRNSIDLTRFLIDTGLGGPLVGGGPRAAVGR